VFTNFLGTLTFIKVTVKFIKFALLQADLEADHMVCRSWTDE
jgi:hypothetical protein